MHDNIRMNNTFNNTNSTTRSKGRPHKDYINKSANITTSDIVALLEPNESDIHDELVRMDSFAYSRYNE